MSDVEVEEITSEGQRCELSEGPHWDVARQSLYYVDIAAPAILRYDFKTKEIYKATIKDDDSPLGFISPVEGKSDEFIVGAKRQILLIRWDGKSGQASMIKVLQEVDQANPTNRINDGKVDPYGKIFFGTMGDEDNFDLSKTRVGTFYSYFSPGPQAVSPPLKPLKGYVGISNGLTWDVERKKFYYIDSVTRDIKVYNYDEHSNICE